MPIHNRRFISHTIDSVNKYNLTIETNRVKVYDEQLAIQIGTDKDFNGIVPDIEPPVTDGSDCIWISWTGDNANNGLSAGSPKRSFTDDAYQSPGTGAVSVAIAAGRNICFVGTANETWIEPAIIPECATLFKQGAGQSPKLRICFRSVPATLTDANTAFVDPNVAGAGTGTWADPFQSLQDAIDANKAYCMIFNSGVSGTAGDFESLVVPEVIDITNDTIITCGIKWGDDGVTDAYFTAGDTAIIFYNASATWKDTSSGNQAYVTSIVSDAITQNIYYAMRSSRYVDYSTDADTFTASDVTGGAENLYSITALGTYVYVGTASRIRRTNDLATWANADASPGGAVKGLFEFNNALYALVEAASLILRTSTDGTTWSTIFTFNATTIPADVFVYTYELNNNLYFTCDGNLNCLDLNNNITNLGKPAGYNVSQIAFYQNDLLISAVTAKQLYRYRNGVFTLIYVYPGSEDFAGIISIYGKLYFQVYSIALTTSAIYLLDSIFSAKQVASSTDFDLAGNMDYFLGYIMIVTGSPSIPVTRFYPAQAYLQEDEIQIRGIEFDSNSSLAAVSVQNVEHDDVQLFNNNMSTPFYACIKDMNDLRFMYYNILHDTQFGLYNLYVSAAAAGNCDIQFNLGYNISNIGIYIDDIQTRTIIDYNTFDNCKYGLYYATPQLPALSHPNYNIFSRCGSSIYSDTVTLIPTYSVITPRSNNINVILGTGSVTNNAVYRDRDNIDYRLQAIGSFSDDYLPYGANSTGVGVGGLIAPVGVDGNGNAYSNQNSDIGCYRHIRPLYSDNWTEVILLNSLPNSMSITNVFKNKTSFESRSGNASQSFNGVRKRFEFSWDEANVLDYIKTHEYLNILESNARCRLRFNSTYYESWDFANIGAWNTSTLRSNIVNGKVGITSLGGTAGTRGALAFNPTALTLTATNLVDRWVPNQWRGYYITIIDNTDVGANYSPRKNEFYIQSNTANVLTLLNLNLVDMSGYTALTSAANDLMILIESIIVRPDISRDFQYTHTIYAGANINDEFPPSLNTTLSFEEVK